MKSATPTRSSNALPMSSFLLCIGVKGQMGTTGSPGRMPYLFAASFLSLAPTSMNMSARLTNVLRSSGVSAWGALEPMTPTSSALRVLTVTRCARTTWSHQPPRVLKRR